MSVSKAHCFMCDQTENISAATNATDVDIIEDDGFITVYPPVISFRDKAKKQSSKDTGLIRDKTGLMQSRMDNRMDNRSDAEQNGQDANN